MHSGNLLNLLVLSKYIAGLFDASAGIKKPLSVQLELRLLTRTSNSKALACVSLEKPGEPIQKYRIANQQCGIFRG
jgi:hypothetical protein